MIEKSLDMLRGAFAPLARSAAGARTLQSTAIIAGVWVGVGVDVGVWRCVVGVVGA